jgi:hypothetical protein
LSRKTNSVEFSPLLLKGDINSPDFHERAFVKPWSRCRRGSRSKVTLIRRRAGLGAAPDLSLSMAVVRMTGRERIIVMAANFDTASDSTDVVDLAWAEMDEFFTALGARGPAATPEQWQEDRARFVEIQQRCNSLVFRDLRTGRGQQPSAPSRQGAPVLHFHSAGVQIGPVRSSFAKGKRNV